MKSKFHLDNLLILIPIGLVVLAVYRVWDIFPTIMQDEYVYLIQSHHLAFKEYEYLNYIFSSVMKSSTLCGLEFYRCTKLINGLLFAIGLLFVFLTARLFLSFYLSVFAVSIAALSPLALQISFFMPEIMYFMSMSISIWVILRIQKKPGWLPWVMPGIAIGLSALIKPHSILILPTIIVYILLLASKSPDKKLLRGISNSSAILAGFTVIKFGVGFLFAGPAGLSWFGKYGTPVSALNSVFRAPEIGSSNPVGNINNPAAELSIQQNSKTPINAPYQDQVFEPASTTFFNVFTDHILLHLGFMMLFGGMVLAYAVQLTYRTIRFKDSISDTSLYFTLILLISITFLIVVPAFEGYVSAIGDDHSARLIFRYYEFLIPQFVIMGLVLSKFVAPALWSRLAMGASVIGASLWFAYSYTKSGTWLFADSATMPGLANTSSIFIPAIFASLAVAYWVEQPKQAARFVGLAATPAVLVLALILSQNTLIDRRGVPSQVDIAASEARQILADVKGEEILIVGQIRSNIFAVKFGLNKPGIKDFVALEDKDVADVLTNEIRYILMLNQYDVSIPVDYLKTSSYFILAKLK
jgi:phosphoglycerol transferase